MAKGASAPAEFRLRLRRSFFLTHSSRCQLLIGSMPVVSASEWYMGAGLWPGAAKMRRPIVCTSAISSGDRFAGTAHALTHSTVNNGPV